MPIQIDQLNIDHLYRNPTTIQSYIDVYQKQLQTKSKNYQRIFTQYVNLKTLQAITDLDALDTIVNRSINDRMYHKYVPNTDQPALTQDLFYEQLTLIQSHLLRPLKSLDFIIKHHQIYLDYRVFNFDLNLFKDLYERNFYIYQVNHWNLVQIKAIQNHQNIFGPRNYLIDNYFQKIILLRHFQNYLKRHLYRQWQKYFNHPNHDPWQRFFEQQTHANANHHVTIDHLDLVNNAQTWHLIEHSHTEYSGMIDDPW